MAEPLRAEPTLEELEAHNAEGVKMLVGFGIDENKLALTALWARVDTLVQLMVIPEREYRFNLAYEKKVRELLAQIAVEWVARASEDAPTGAPAADGA